MLKWAEVMNWGAIWKQNFYFFSPQLNVPEFLRHSSRWIWALRLREFQCLCFRYTDLQWWLNFALVISIFALQGQNIQTYDRMIVWSRKSNNRKLNSKISWTNRFSNSMLGGLQCCVASTFSRTILRICIYNNNNNN